MGWKTDLFIQEPVTGYDPSGRQLSDHKCPACPAGGRNFAAEGIQDHRPGDLKGHGADRMARKVRDIVQKPYFIVDGAHNEDAARKLAQTVQFYFTNKKIIYIMGVLRDKEYEKIAEIMSPFADSIITVTTPGNPRALSALTLAETVAKYHNRVTAADSLEEAVEMSYLLADKDSVILAFGSLSYLGQIMDIIDKMKTKRA